TLADAAHAVSETVQRKAQEFIGALGGAKPAGDAPSIAATKPYFIGRERVAASGPALPAFEWEEPADPPILTTRLHETHKALGARMVPFAGYDMPVWYTSVGEEHAAVR